MSLVVFPFKVENPEVVVHNVRIAASHPRVSEVLCIGVEEESTYHGIAAARPDIQSETGKSVQLILQQRLGEKRPGKGDGMNTALKYFLHDTDHERIHFYDSDITTFTEEWITKAEQAADFDYGVVRHYFPRSSTDAMITWMITRTGFAHIWPHSELPWIEQPLGGELLFKRHVVERLMADERVLAQSDWGIDTIYTFATTQYGYPMYETYIADGKAHKLYGKLTDLRTMLVECFSTIQSLQHEEVSEGIIHRVEHPDVVPDLIREKVGFDFEGTLRLLQEGWSNGQSELLQLFPMAVRDGMLANRESPRFSFMDENNWSETYKVLLEHFDGSNPEWAELLFKLWTVRVLNYTTIVALRGFEYAQRYLQGMVQRFMQQALQ